MRQDTDRPITVASVTAALEQSKNLEVRVEVVKVTVDLTRRESSL